MAFLVTAVFGGAGIERVLRMLNSRRVKINF
jgi:hypothetical protein